MITRKTLTFQNAPISLHWKGIELVDHVSRGDIYTLEETYKSSSRYFSYPFDTAIQSDDNTYVIVYQKLGTKGLLLKNGELLRELHRSYYQATAYEYPITFAQLPTGENILIHCPNEYNLIEIEDLETGELLTKIPAEREPHDCFQSRFRVNPSGTTLLNVGWVWHPYSIIEYFDIQKGLQDNTHFDKGGFEFPFSAEISSAEFLDDDLIVINSINEEQGEEPNDAELQDGQIGLFSIAQQRFIKKVTIDCPLGTLIPIDENRVIDLYQYPKLIDLNTGQIIQKFEDIPSGKQNSSIIHHIDPIPPIAIDKINNRIAIANGKVIEVLHIK